jgi:hypothetical protein
MEFVTFVVQDPREQSQSLSAPPLASAQRQSDTCNRQFSSLEYGTTLTLGKNIHFAPDTRLGNITRIFNQPDPNGEAGKNMLELSYPALRGATAGGENRRGCQSGNWPNPKAG